MIVITATRVIFGLLTLSTNSIWPALFIHAAHNSFLQVLFEPCSVDRIHSYYVGEAGMITAVFSMILSIIMYQRYKKRLTEERMFVKEHIYCNKW